jgi:hypothetical protein
VACRKCLKMLLDHGLAARRLHDDHRTHDRPRSSQAFPPSPRETRK